MSRWLRNRNRTLYSTHANDHLYQFWWFITKWSIDMFFCTNWLHYYKFCCRKKCANCPSRTHLGHFVFSNTKKETTEMEMGTRIFKLFIVIIFFLYKGQEQGYVWRKYIFMNYIDLDSVDMVINFCLVKKNPESNKDKATIGPMTFSLKKHI